MRLPGELNVLVSSREGSIRAFHKYHDRERRKHLGDQDRAHPGMLSGILSTSIPLVFATVGGFKKKIVFSVNMCPREIFEHLVSEIFHGSFH